MRCCILRRGRRIRCRFRRRPLRTTEDVLLAFLRIAVVLLLLRGFVLSRVLVIVASIILLSVLPPLPLILILLPFPPPLPRPVRPHRRNMARRRRERRRLLPQRPLLRQEVVHVAHLRVAVDDELGRLVLLLLLLALLLPLALSQVCVLILGVGLGLLAPRSAPTLLLEELGGLLAFEVDRGLEVLVDGVQAALQILR